MSLHSFEAAWVSCRAASGCDVPGNCVHSRSSMVAMAPSSSRKPNDSAALRTRFNSLQNCCCLSGSLRACLITFCRSAWNSRETLTQKSLWLKDLWQSHFRIQECLLTKKVQAAHFPTVLVFLLPLHFSLNIKVFRYTQFQIMQQQFWIDLEMKQIKRYTLNAS